MWENCARLGAVYQFDFLVHVEHGEELLSGVLRHPERPSSTRPSFSTINDQS
jgi:hypothetical protein